MSAQVRIGKIVTINEANEPDLEEADYKRQKVWETHSSDTHVEDG